MWEVEYTDEFGVWFETLTESERDALEAAVDLLAERGPALGRPFVDTIKGSKHRNMKELRTQSKGEPLRTFFAFDPRRCAILLIGGNKGGDKRFYEKMVPVAERLYEEHLEALRKEGLI